MLKKLLLFFTLVFILTVYSRAQGRLEKSPTRSYYTYIYRLSDAEATGIFTKGKKVVQKSFFHTLADSFALGTPFTRQLPQGHYLFLHSQGPDLRYELQSFSTFSARILPLKNSLAVVVQDSAGRPVTDARVAFNKRKASYDAITQTYCLKQPPAEGLLSVTWNGFTFLEEWEKEQRQTPVLKKLAYTVPVSYFWRPVYAVYQSIRSRYPQDWLRRVWAIFNEDYRRQSSPGKQPYQGYLLTNKPLYRPGDTVRYKAFITNKKGRPVKGKALLELKRFSQPARKLAELSPYRKGAYEGSFVLHDSLKLELDRNYTLELGRYKKIWQPFISSSFRLEDYELKENTYRLELQYETHGNGQQNSLVLQGSNASGLNLPDARVEISLKTQRVKGSQETQVFVPDTLWRHQQGLEARGATTILLPEKAFPKASLDYALTVSFLDASNEKHTSTKYGRYQYAPASLKLDLLQDSLLARYLEDGREKTHTATLTAYDADYEKISSRLLQLPARLPLLARAASYELEAGKLQADLDLEEEKSLLGLQALREADSLFFEVQNPRRLPFWFFVYQGEKLLARGQGQETKFLFRRRVKGKQPCFVVLHYQWAGTMRQLRQDVPLLRHQLHIALQAPPVVYPGQQTQVKVAVTDAAGRPVPEVDLTAYALTAKFKDQKTPELPSWDRYKTQKPVSRYEQEDRIKTGERPLDWNYWSRRMGLDSMAYYQFLRPSQGVFTEYAPNRDSLTLVSPFVVDSGRVVPVHVVYLDEVPVYFSQAGLLPAYAFAADSGFHTLKLRTADKLITLDSVYLRHRQKLILSADLSAAARLRAQPVEKNYLSAAERYLLYQYLFQVVYTPGDTLAYLKQGNHLQVLNKGTFPRSGYYGNRRSPGTVVAGPYRPTWMQYVQADNFSTNFKMEPGYSYHFHPHLLKMREWKQTSLKVPLKNGEVWKFPENLLHQQVETEKRIQESWEEAQQELFLGYLYAGHSRPTPGQENGRLGWDLDAAIKQQVKLVLLHQPGKPDSLLIYPREQKLIPNLKSADYQLTLAFTNGDYVTREVPVKPHGQTQVYFSFAQVQPSCSYSRHLLQVVAGRVAKLRSTRAETLREERQRLELNKQATFSLQNGSGLYSKVVTGVVTDVQDNTPIPGVTVLVKGTYTGTSTDAAGRYKLYVPETGRLVFNFIGFTSREEVISGNVIDVQLDPDVKMLQEVVVMGYGVQKKTSMTASIATVTGALQGRVAGVVIRGVGSMKAGQAQPLLIVDGLPSSASLEALDPQSIQSLKILKDAEATALYGAAGAAGVVVVTTKKGGSPAGGPKQDLEKASALRSNFSDYAFWQPRLQTDKKGEASFTATFPDDITRWNAYVLAMDGKKHSGLQTTSVNAFKAMMATLHLPRFLVEGDRADVVGRAANYLPDTATVTTTFMLEGKPGKVARRLLDRGFSDTLLVTAPAAGQDSLAISYSLQQGNGFADGERRYVGIRRKGLEEHTGRFLLLDADTTFSLTFDPAKGPVRLRTQGDLLEVMLEEIDHLHRYEYWCSEQAASKLKALLLEQQVRRQLKQNFAHKAMVGKLIRHLEKTQLAGGGWTWWQQGPAYPWITAQAAEALAMARKAGYPLGYREQDLVQYLTYQVSSATGAADKLRALETLLTLGAKIDYPTFVKELEKWKRPLLEDQLRLTRLRQRLKLPAPLDTLQKYRRQTTLGGLYWGEARFSLFNNTISNTLLAYEILDQAGNHERELARIRAYLLSERRDGHWRNTFESARVLETLLPDLLAGQTGIGEGAPHSLRFSGALNLAGKGFRTDTTFAAGSPLQISKQGRLPVYLTAYQTLWNPEPREVEKDFVVKTTLKGSKNLKDTQSQLVLQAGTAVEMLVEVEAKADADYVMIEVPIPASCTYESKEGRGPYQVHREYFRDKVSIFCARLPKGRHTYSIQLLPRYTGTYTLNPARASLMYFPTFFGRNEMQQVQVK